MRRLETDRLVVYYPAPRRAEAERALARLEPCLDSLALRAPINTWIANRTPVLVMPEAPFNNAYVAPPLAGVEPISVLPTFNTLIADGHHLSPSVLKVMARAKGAARTLLVTDAVAAAGQPPGRYRLGELEVELTDDGRVIEPATGRFAGSALRMDEAVGNLVRFTGCALEDALAAAGEGPARALGRAPVGAVSASWDPTASRLRVERVTGGD